MYEKLNQVSINNTLVIIDIFYSVKYESLTFIINNSNYILDNTHINIENDMKILIDNIHYKNLEYIDITDFEQIDKLNCKNFFKNDGFHINIGIIKNIKNFIKTNIINITLKIINELYTFNIDTSIISKYINNKCLTTIHKDQHHLLYSWISYHKKIGFEKFIIYDNNFNETENNKLLEIFKDDICIINANWQYWLYANSIGQVIQQNHCIWKYCPKYLGLTDLDEYININKSYLFNEKYSVVSIPNTFFGCGRNIIYNSYNFIEKMLYREKQYDLLARRKCIIKSFFVDLFCVHIPVIFDKNILYLNFNDGYLNHYRQLSCNKDIICNCQERCNIYDNTILRYLNP